LEYETSAPTPSVPLIYKKQLQYIHELAGFARISRLGFWLAGGWAVEALTEEESPRLHSDVDALILRKNSAQWHGWLSRHRFNFPGELYYGFNAMRQSPGGPIVLHFIFLDWEDDRRVATFLPEHTVIWACEDPATMPQAMLGGKEVPVCDWEMAFAVSEMLKFLDPEGKESPDLAYFEKQIKPARRKAISKSLIVPFKPSPA
jgi:hypothetical protein